ncbi:hypothetical protein ACSSS7_002811 [Eimeria intestinalis]
MAQHRSGGSPDTPATPSRWQSSPPVQLTTATASTLRRLCPPITPLQRPPLPAEGAAWSRPRTVGANFPAVLEAFTADLVDFLSEFILCAVWPAPFLRIEDTPPDIVQRRRGWRPQPQYQRELPRTSNRAQEIVAALRALGGWRDESEHESSGRVLGRVEPTSPQSASRRASAPALPQSRQDNFNAALLQQRGAAAAPPQPPLRATSRPLISATPHSRRRDAPLAGKLLAKYLPPPQRHRGRLLSTTSNNRASPVGRLHGACPQQPSPPQPRSQRPSLCPCFFCGDASQGHRTWAAYADACHCDPDLPAKCPSCRAHGFRPPSCRRRRYLILGIRFDYIEVDRNERSYYLRDDLPSPTWFHVVSSARSWGASALLPQLQWPGASNTFPIARASAALFSQWLPWPTSSPSPTPPMPPPPPSPSGTPPNLPPATKPAPLAFRARPTRPHTRARGQSLTESAAPPSLILDVLPPPHTTTWIRAALPCAATPSASPTAPAVHYLTVADLKPSASASPHRCPPASSNAADTPLHLTAGWLLAKTKVIHPAYVQALRHRARAPTPQPPHDLPAYEQVSAGLVPLLPSANNCLQPAKLTQLRQLLYELRNHFNDGSEPLQATSLLTARLDSGDAAPIPTPPRRLSPAMRQVVRGAVADLDAKGTTEPSTGCWKTPLVMVGKGSGAWRKCCDYRAINKHVRIPQQPLPCTDDILASPNGKRYFFVRHVPGILPVRDPPGRPPENQLRHPRRQYRRLPFGFASSPAIFQRMVDMLLGGMKWVSAVG